MADIERMTVTLTAEQVVAVKEAVESGAYASSSEIVREALRDWMYRQAGNQGDSQKRDSHATTPIRGSKVAILRTAPRSMQAAQVD